MHIRTHLLNPLSMLVQEFRFLLHQASDCLEPGLHQLHPTSFFWCDGLRVLTLRGLLIYVVSSAQQSCGRQAIPIEVVPCLTRPSPIPPYRERSDTSPQFSLTSRSTTLLFTSSLHCQPCSSTPPSDLALPASFLLTPKFLLESSQPLPLSAQNPP